jgi:hypothetical protein
VLDKDSQQCNIKLSAKDLHHHLNDALDVLQQLYDIFLTYKGVPNIARHVFGWRLIRLKELAPLSFSDGHSKAEENTRGNLFALLHHVEDSPNVVIVTVLGMKLGWKILVRIGPIAPLWQARRFNPCGVRLVTELSEQMSSLYMQKSRLTD